MLGILRFLTGRKRREQHTSHRRPRARSWDHLEERWPSPGGWASAAARAADAAAALDNELDWQARTGLLPRNEITGLPDGWAYWPVQQPDGLIEEPPAPELLDGLPAAPHPHPSCCGRPQELECAWLGERGYLCFTHDWRWHEAEERLAETGDWPAFAADVERNAAELDEDLGEAAETAGDLAPVAAAVVEALDQLDEEQLAELLGPDEHCERSELDNYLDDLEVLTRYRIPAPAE